MTTSNDDLTSGDYAKAHDSSKIGLRVAAYGMASMLSVSGALGQEANSGVVNTEGATVLETITVTGRKTTEDLKDVPLSASVIDPEILETSAADPGTAIATAPNVQWQSQTVGRQFFSIRGVSSLGAPLNYSDGTVSLNVDGVPNSMITASSPLLDVDHVEILRGPQGTLWGANSLGGAINVVTNQPDGEREVKATTEIGENGYRMGEFILGGNIIPDSVDGRLAVRFTHMDGDIDSLYTDDLNARMIGAVRGGLRFTGLDDTTITVTGSYFRDRNTAPFYVLGNAAGFPLSGSLTEPENVTSHGDGVVSITHNFDAFDLTSVTSIQHNKIDGYLDNTDALISPAWFPSDPASLVDREKIYSQEFRLNSLQGDPVRWVVGASVAYSDLHRDCFATNCAPSNTIKMTADLRALNLGLFGDVSVPLGESWEVSLGGRLSHDRIKMRKGSDSGDPRFNGEGSVDDTYLTGRTSIAYKWNDNAQTYASVSRGQSTPVYPLFGYPTTGVLDDPYPAAKGWTYEVGTKVTLFDNRLQLDGSVFYNDIKNGTVFYVDPSAMALAATYQDYETSGLELQARAELAKDWVVTGGVGYTHSKLGRSGANAGTEGNQVPNIPEWSTSVGLEYSTPVSIFDLDGEVTAAVQYQFNGKRTADVADTFELSSYSLVNARVGWKNSGADFEIYGFGRNLFDERYETFASAGFTPGDRYVGVGRGRILGIGMSKSF
ncbi:MULTISPECIES: TonB-dependent receptor [unclassified Rhizobium]|uniref:TonB-dependent receptor n=1 Tax=unclassified Rhizobium TaxID=2613769 RepID=UPI000BCB61B6|nr:MULTISPECIES: TonB-dependent receptor [unclassified Rhizobium]MDH7809524.1 iron complex outermembrane receptor protein [Rhizobium sp. AN67]MDQ4408769.1 TonB-dependent receptor [Rhizobium sp. AN63]SOD50455.1 iron complex outermembrane recepter protein [Rhizobium sp. AN6A]